MSYYDPLYPIIQNTRNQIQSSILALQEKLRQRKQIDYDIQNIMQDETVRTNYLLQQQRYPPLTRPIAEPDLSYQAYIQDKILGEKIKVAREEEDAAFLHMNKMDVLGKEKLQLSRQRLREQYVYELSEEERLKKRLQNLYDDDETLIRKYQDGTKMKEYNHQLESYSNTRRNLHESPQKISKPVNRSLAHEFKSQSLKKFESSGKARKPSGEQGFKRSPYARLDMETDIKQNESPEKNDFYMQKINRGKNEDTNFSKRSFENITLSKKKREFEEQGSRSPYYKEERKSKSTNRKNKSKTKSRYVEKSRSRSIIRSTEADAIKRIQNRLKLSEIVYEDSKFRNVKHEMSHLDMTYENETKARKDIRDKLNNHPLILKKHAMVVE